MAEPIRSVLVVGGGTAGWMAAAALNSALGPHCQVGLVESDEIGIVGVGEATVPTVRDFNNLIRLNEAEFMRETRATLKLGIEFVDWGRKGTAYFHPFGTFGGGATLGEFAQTWLTLNQRGLTGEITDWSICAQAARRGRVGARQSDPRSPYLNLYTAFHFDAGLYALYLRKVCEARGVERIEGKITEVVQRPEDGFVSGVKLADERVLEADFFIDCSGFRGLLIEGAMKAGFEDWSHWLPMNRAVAMPCAPVTGITPYTRSTALDAGWRWRIPLQHRTGNGHVYCADHIDDETALNQLVDGLDGEAMADPRLIRFQTGKRKAFWAKNVCALGLATGFIEPLESTSIHLIHVGIAKMLQHFPDRDFSPVNIDTYNTRMDREVQQVRDFVILHYHASERDDSEFWRRVRDMPIPDTLAERVEAYRDRGMIYQVAADEYFSMASWMAVMTGQGIRPRMANPLYAFQNLPRAREGFERVRATFAEAAEALPTHEAFLRAENMWKTA